MSGNALPPSPRGSLRQDGLVDDLLGRTLVAVERLSWTEPARASNPRVGPVHLHFSGGRGVFLSGGTDWSLGALTTRAGDESWLLPYRYEIEGSSWVIRDASDEVPFREFRGARLDACASIRNEMGEQVGLTFEFERSAFSLHAVEGEVAT